jgi:lambda repressor-like predicted transcriptional regulator
MNSNDRGDIIARYEFGATTAELAAVYRVSKSRISAVLREHGVTLRRQGLTEKQTREAADYYIAGRSLAWLATRCGVSPTTVSRALQRQGVTLRPRPGRQ